MKIKYTQGKITKRETTKFEVEDEVFIIVDKSIVPVTIKGVVIAHEVMYLVYLNGNALIKDSEFVFETANEAAKKLQNAYTASFGGMDITLTNDRTGLY